MKFLATSLILFLALSSEGQEFPDSIIRTNRIYQITKLENSTSKNEAGAFNLKWKTITVFNKLGYPIKAVDISYYSYGIDSSVTTFFYKDTLLIKVKWQQFESGKLVEGSVETLTYRYDSINRKISVRMSYESGRETREEYDWLDANKLQGIRYYSNDSSIYIPERRGYDHVFGEKLKLTKTVKYTWRGDQMLAIEECNLGCRYKYISESMCCSTTEFINHRDTSVTTRKLYTEGGWHTYVQKKTTIGTGTVYEEGEWGDKTITFIQRNKKGLITRSESYQIQRQGSLQHRVATYIYSFHTR